MPLLPSDREDGDGALKPKEERSLAVCTKSETSGNVAVRGVCCARELLLVVAAAAVGASASAVSMLSERAIGLSADGEESIAEERRLLKSPV